jgi:hypothetical protein
MCYMLLCDMHTWNGNVLVCVAVRVCNVDCIYTRKASVCYDCHAVCRVRVSRRGEQDVARAGRGENRS